MKSEICIIAHERCQKELAVVTNFPVTFKYSIGGESRLISWISMNLGEKLTFFGRFWVILSQGILLLLGD